MVIKAASSFAIGGVVVALLVFSVPDCQNATAPTSVMLLMGKSSRLPPILVPDGCATTLIVIASDTNDVPERHAHDDVCHRCEVDRRSPAAAPRSAGEAEPRRHHDVGGDATSRHGADPARWW